MKSTLEEHSHWITDVRFSPSMSRLATSSADKTVRVWDADNVSWHIPFFFHLFNLIYFFVTSRLDSQHVHVCYNDASSSSSLLFYLFIYPIWVGVVNCYIDAYLFLLVCI